MQKQVKQATDLATGTAGSISGAAFGGTGVISFGRVSGNTLDP